MIVQGSGVSVRFLSKPRAQAFLSRTGRLAGILGLLLVFALLVAPVNAAVYKWTDSSGQVHYTDQWQEGSRAVDLPEPSVYTPAPVPGATRSPAAGAEVSPESEYEVFEVSAPAADETIRNNEGKVTVSLRLEPTLRESDMIELFIDGNKITGELRSPVVTLSNLNRGTHSVKARVIDASGKELISSESVTFHLRRESRLFPNRPKPTPLPETEPEPGTEPEDNP